MMTLQEAIQMRHSVRSFTDQQITGEVKQQLEDIIAQCNKETGMRIQLVTDEPDAFTGLLAHYGKFVNTKNYIGLIGPKSLPYETIGYYGEKIVFRARQLGLNTCWVAVTFSKKHCACKVGPGEKMPSILAIGYGTSQGSGHTPKPLENLYKSEVAPVPKWFLDGVKAAQLAPTAMHQQKFEFTLHADNTVSAKTKLGFCTQLDLGIAKYHFEIGAGTDGWRWR